MRQTQGSSWWLSPVRIYSTVRWSAGSTSSAPSREGRVSKRYEYVPHRLLRHRVRDIASGAEGELTAVIHENVSDSTAYERWMELAYIRDASGREFTTAIHNIDPVSRQA